MAEAPNPAATCPGYVRSSIFSSRCRYCGGQSSQHPPVQLEKSKHQPLSSSELLKLDRGYYRWSTELSMHMQKKFLPALAHANNAWAFLSNTAKEDKARADLCERFLRNVPFNSSTPRLGCCHQLIKLFETMETLVQQAILREQDVGRENERITPLIRQQGTREYRHFTYIMERWREHRLEALAIDKKIKTACGRDDFIQAAPMPPPPTIPVPVFQDRKKIDKCPECHEEFGFGRKSRHCRHCLRVVCEKCTVKKVFSKMIGRKIRLCTGCLTYVATDE